MLDRNRNETFERDAHAIAFFALLKMLIAHVAVAQPPQAREVWLRRYHDFTQNYLANDVKRMNPDGTREDFPAPVMELASQMITAICTGIKL